MKATQEQKQRWIDLHKRMADAGWATTQHKGDDEFGLYAAEVKKLNVEIDALLREIIGDDAYAEYQQELKRIT